MAACPDHVWALVQRTGADLARLTGEHVLQRIDEALRMTDQLLHKPDPSPLGFRLVARMSASMFGAHRREARARQHLLRTIPCRICHRLEITEKRSFALLAAVLANPQHRAAAAQGCGLCFKHLAAALGVDAPAPIQRALVEFELARLPRLEWELEQALRKVAWDARCESRGTETTAWRRALFKFSGWLAEDLWPADDRPAHV